MIKYNSKRILCLLLAVLMLVLVGCEDSEDRLDRLKDDDIKVEVANKAAMQTLKTTNATKKILYVPTKYTDFWSAIDNNFIDVQYNKTKVKKGNIRLLIKANKNYAYMWMDELEKTYEEVKRILPKTSEELVEKQYNNFKDYYDNTEKMYTFVLDVDDEYKGNIDGNYKIRQYYALADEARSYTIMLKEYIYLTNKNVEFYTQGEEKGSNLKKDSYSKNGIKLTFDIVVDKKFKDIVTDAYDKKVECSVKKLKGKNALKKVEKYYKYWDKEVKDSYDELEDKLEGEHKDIIRDQKNAYFKFVDATLEVQNKVLHSSKVYKNLYKENVTVENGLYKGTKLMKYNILLLEYYYAIEGKVKM